VTETSLPVLTIEEILSATGGTLVRGDGTRVMKGLSTDSRTIGSGNLFIALVGERFDGHEYLRDAVRAGAAGLLVHRRQDAVYTQISPEIPIVFVQDTLRALGDIAHFRRRQLTIPVIAVTGSSGKTTTKEMLATIMARKKKVLKSPGNFNNLIGLPRTLLEVDESHEVAILEMGTNTKGEIARLTDICAPDIGIITNIGPAHLEGLGSIAGVREEKGDLFAHMHERGTVVINNDDAEVAILARRWRGGKITFGIRREADVHAEHIVHLTGGKMGFTLSIGSFREAISMSVLGEHNIYNALAAAASSRALGIEDDVICTGLKEFAQVNGRMSLYCLNNGVYLIDDTYNANPASMREALQTLMRLSEGQTSVVIFGDMLELGNGSEEMHSEIGRQLADTGVDRIFLMGRFARAVVAGAHTRGLPDSRVTVVERSADILANLTACVPQGGWILVKGSRGMKMEEITRAIMGQFGHAGCESREGGDRP